MTADHAALRLLPRVDDVADDVAVVATGASPARRRDAARAAIDAARDALRAGAAAADVLPGVAADAARRLALAARPTLVPVLNATGVVVHTNLGRAPLPAEAVAAALGPCNLEYDLEAGTRGSRREHAETLLRALSGAEAALVVNNNAAAVVLMLAAHAKGREVLIARGELVEIGGSFRVPEIMEAAGARLREVGTTNRTYARDYERAIGPETAAILRVHPSNYAITGFTHRPEPRELASLAAARGIRFLRDLGTGTFGPLPAGLPGDGAVADAVAGGADVACFSGDKLLGGPQAGIALGRADAIDAMARHPLARAMRADKLTLCALQYCLTAYMEERYERIPGHAMLHCTAAALEARARRAAAALAIGGAEIAVAPCEDVVGGGSHPDARLPGWAVTIATPAADASALSRALRLGATAVVATVAADRVWLHLRTVPPERDGDLVEAAREALRAVGTRGAANAG